jgi:mannose/fructose/N-acetylgalactosamine-specific phosphotransferase system component IID
MPVKITIDLPDHKEVLKRLTKPLDDLSDENVGPIEKVGSILGLLLGGAMAANPVNLVSPTVSISDDQGRQVEFPMPIVPVSGGIPLITAKFMQGFMDRMRALQAR